MVLNTLKLALAASLIIGLSGCSILPGSKKASSAQNTSKITQAQPRLGVNSFLWRASLETLNFMPMESVDPFGGVIISEWHASAEAPNERFKVTTYILDTQLRADALKVSAFKQVQGAGGWTDAPIDADTARQIENSILARARELYIASN